MDDPPSRRTLHLLSTGLLLLFAWSETAGVAPDAWRDAAGSQAVARSTGVRLPSGSVLPALPDFGPAILTPAQSLVSVVATVSPSDWPPAPGRPPRVANTSSRVRAPPAREEAHAAASPLRPNPNDGSRGVLLLRHS